MRSKKSRSSSCTQLEPIPRVPTPTRPASRADNANAPRLAQTAAAVSFTMKLRATSAVELRKVLALQRSGTQATLPPLAASPSSKKLMLAVRRNSGAGRGGRPSSRSSSSRPVTPDTQSSTPLARDDIMDHVASAEKSLPGWAAAKAFLDRACSDGCGISTQERLRVKQVFERFKDQNAHEIHRSDLCAAARHLGYVGVNHEASIQVASQLSEYPTLDLEEFVVFLEQYTMQEQAEIERIFVNYASKFSQKVPLRAVPAIVHDLGLTSLQAAISESLDAAQLSSHQALSVNQLRAFLATHLSAEGYTKEERDRARQAFDQVREGKSDLPPRSVGDAMALFRGADARQEWGDIWHRLGCHASSQDEGDSPVQVESRSGPSVDFHEFLVWARRLEVQELSPIQDGFHRVDKDADGMVSAGEFLDMIPLELSVVFSSKLSQILLEGGVAPGQLLSFDDAVRVLRNIRSTGNQTKQEIKEFEEVFKLFDSDNSGKMDVTEMVDVLMYLGYNSTLETTQEMMRRSDVDGNDELDCEEFLACMRQHEIMQSRALKSAFGQASDAGTCNHLELATVLLALELFSGQAKLNQMLKEGGMEHLEEFNFRQVCELAKNCRQAVAKVNRQRACFPRKHVQALERLFKEYAPSGTMDRGGLICCLSILDLPMNTMQEREGVLSQLDAARYAAQAFGVEEVSFSDTHMLTFYKLLHLLRLVCVRHRRAVMERELAALNSTGIAQTEVVEFREVFHKLAMEKACSTDGGGASVQKVASSRRRSQPAPPAPPTWEVVESVSASGNNFRYEANYAIAELKAFLCVGGKGPQIFVQDVMDLLLDLGVPLTSKQQIELRYKATVFAAHHNDAVDFASFIQLIRWMLDTNLGDINRKTSGNGAMKGFQAASAALSVSLRSRFTASRRASAS